MKNITLKSTQFITATATPQKILGKPIGLRSSLMIQAQGVDQIAVYFSQNDVDNDNFWVLNPLEWPFWDSLIINNEIFIKSLGASQKVVYQANENK